MPFALLVHDDRYDTKAVVQIADEAFGHAELQWVDVTDKPEVQIGDIVYADGRIGPFVPPLDMMQAIHISDLRSSCTVTITSGFTSDALGKSYAYGSSDKDQANLRDDAADAQAADAAWRAQIWCADAKGAWAMRAHNATQVAQVLTDFRAMRSAAQAKLAKLTDSANSAKSVDIVRAVAWS